MEKYNKLIWVATPTRDGKAHAKNMMSVFALQTMALKGESRGFAFAHDVSQGSPNIPRQRNWSVARAEQAGAEGILFLDSDIAFDPNDALDIFERSEDIIGVGHQTRPRMWTDRPNVSGRFFGHNTRVPIFDTSKDLLRANKLTTGFLYVKMGVFKKLREAGLAKQFVCWTVPPEAWKYCWSYFSYEMNKAIPPSNMVPLLERVGMPTDEVTVFDGEDWAFNDKCHEAGVESWIEPLMTLHHYEGSMCMNVGLHDFWTQHEPAFRDKYITWLRARAARDPKAAAAVRSWDNIAQQRQRNAEVNQGKIMGVSQPVPATGDNSPA